MPDVLAGAANESTTDRDRLLVVDVSTPPPTIAARVRERLTEDIITGFLLPGARLDERLLAERFEVSRTPVREALRELGARGLVDITPRRGIVVAQVSIERLAQLLEADCDLEALCARRAAESMTSMERTELEILHEQSSAFVIGSDEAGYLEINTRFHALVRAGAHNDVLAQTAQDLHDRLAPFRRAQSGVESRFKLSHDEHDAVVRAILANRPETAFEAMRNHSTRLSARVLGLMRDARERRAARP